MATGRRRTFGRWRGATAEIQAAAIENRRRPTAAEAVLWEALRDRQLGGLKFRRQHPVGQFILDFYCPARKLVIEIDGESHIGREHHDEARTQCLAAFGYTVIRVSNAEVLGNLDHVLERILLASETLPPTSTTWRERPPP